MNIDNKNAKKKLNIADACIEILKGELNTEFSSAELQEIITQKRKDGSYSINASNPIQANSIKKSMSRKFGQNKNLDKITINEDEGLVLSRKTPKGGNKNFVQYKLTKVEYKEEDIYELVRTACNFMDFSAIHSHNKSNNSEEGALKHPDLVGFSLTPNKIPNLSMVTKDLLSALDYEHLKPIECFSFHSIEVKVKKMSKGDVAQSLGQFTSNGEWANYNWLVLFECTPRAVEEAKELAEKHEFGLLVLYTEPVKVDLIVQPKRREIGSEHLSKLTNLVDDFKKFVEKAVTVIKCKGKIDKEIFIPPINQEECGKLITQKRIPKLEYPNRKQKRVITK